MDRKQNHLEEVVAHVVSSNAFQSAPRLIALLQYIANAQPDGPAPKEYEIGRAVFERPEDFDPRVDSIVRVQVARLRRKLHDYYAGEGKLDPMRLDLPKGQYRLLVQPFDVDGTTSSERAIDPVKSDEPSPTEAEPITLPPPAVDPRPNRSRNAAFILIAIAITGGLGWTVFSLSSKWRVSNPSLKRYADYQGRMTRPLRGPDGSLYFLGEEPGKTGLYVQRLLPEASRPDSLMLGPTPILGISPKGSIGYISDDANFIVGCGTLSIHPSPSASAETRISHVCNFAYDPNGRILAIRTDGNERTLEYPLGTILERRKSLEHMAFLHAKLSPDQKNIAFWEWSAESWRLVIRSSSADSPKITTLVRDVRFPGEICWSNKSDAIYMQALAPSGTYALQRVTLEASNGPRTVYESPNAITPIAQATDGRLLIVENQTSLRMFVTQPNNKPDRELVWIRGLVLTSVSLDGRLAMARDTFTNRYFIGEIDSKSQPQALGTGVTGSLAYSGRQAVLLQPKDKDFFVNIVPIPPPAEGGKLVKLEGFTTVTSVGWLADEDRILVLGTKPNAASRSWILSTKTGAITSQPALQGNYFMPNAAGGFCYVDVAGSALFVTDAQWKIARSSPWPIGRLIRCDPANGFAVGLFMPPNNRQLELFQQPLDGGPKKAILTRTAEPYTEFNWFGSISRDNTRFGYTVIGNRVSAFWLSGVD